MITSASPAPHVLAACNRGQNGYRVVVFNWCIQILQKTDVFFIHVNIDEGFEIAVRGVNVLRESLKLSFKAPQHFANVRSLDMNLVFAGCVFAKNGWYENVYCHDAPPRS